MKNFFLLLITSISLLNFARAQEVPMNEAIKWNYTVEFTSATEANVIVTARLYHHFHLFSLLHVPADYDFTGNPTVLNFKKNDAYQLIGKVKESKPERGSDDYGNYIWHADKAVFTQKIKILSKTRFDLNFDVEWQICNDVMCHMPQRDSKTLKIDPAAGKSLGATDNTTILPTIDPMQGLEELVSQSPVSKMLRGTCEVAEELDSLPISLGVRAVRLNESEFQLIYVVKGDEGWKIPSGNNGLFKNIQFSTNSAKHFKVAKVSFPKSEKYYDSVYKREIEYFASGAEFTQIIEIISSTKDSVVNGVLRFEGLSDKEYFETDELFFTYNLAKAPLTDDEDTSKKSYWYIFGLAFLGGLAALLTPCVFPMIPMTVSFFLKQGKNKSTGIRNALIYSLSIIAIYITLGLGITLIFGASALNAMSTNIFFNIAFFLLLVVFGASFLGAFEIRMPASWINKADARADKGGIIGIFFMAFTLALVSFSCTGPIIGTLLVTTANDVMAPFIGMLGFSLALALPFGLFSAFPAWLNSMPQSGGWLNVIKVVLGFLEIALAFKFLSNADLVVQAHLLEREVFIALWIVIFALLGFYLLGKLRFSHDSEMHYVPVPRLFMGIFVFSFVIYMIPGMWGAPLKILSGFLPPQHYSEIPYGILGKAPQYKLPKHAHYGPHGIPVFHDYDHAKHYADSIGKPMMLDFTGHACINCRKMEDQVWSTEEVKRLLIDSVVVVSLYVDEKTSLPLNEQIKDEKGKMLTTVGDKWSYLQRVKYGQQTQPQYILLDKDENKLSPSTTYKTEGDRIKDFKKWLDDGVTEYESRKNLVSVRGSALIKPKECIDPKNPQSYSSMYEELYGEALVK